MAREGLRPPAGLRGGRAIPEDFFRLPRADRSRVSHWVVDPPRFGSGITSQPLGGSQMFKTPFVSLSRVPPPAARPGAIAAAAPPWTALEARVALSGGLYDGQGDPNPNPVNPGAPPLPDSPGIILSPPDANNPLAGIGSNPGYGDTYNPSHPQYVPLANSGPSSTMPVPISGPFKPPVGPFGIPLPVVPRASHPAPPPPPPAPVVHLPASTAVEAKFSANFVPGYFES